VDEGIRRRRSKRKGRICRGYVGEKRVLRRISKKSRKRQQKEPCETRSNLSRAQKGTDIESKKRRPGKKRKRGILKGLLGFGRKVPPVRGARKGKPT